MFSMQTCYVLQPRLSSSTLEIRQSQEILCPLGTKETERIEEEKLQQQQLQRQQQIGQDRTCPICLEDFLIDNNIFMLPCGHLLHQICVTQLRKYGLTQLCPLCRKAIG